MPVKSLVAQVRDTMLITVFVFLGIEGASVYSRFAQKRSDVGSATILGFVGVTGLMVAVTLLPYAALPQSAIAAVQQPSMAGVLEAVVGHWGPYSFPSACWFPFSVPISHGLSFAPRCFSPQPNRRTCQRCLRHKTLIASRQMLSG